MSDKALQMKLNGQQDLKTQTGLSYLHKRQRKDTKHKGIQHIQISTAWCKHNSLFSE